jgi:hypothetical protein
VVKELLARDRSLSKDINPITCTFAADGQPVGSSAKCIAPFDAALLQDQQTKAILQLLAGTASNPAELKASIAAYVLNSMMVPDISTTSSPSSATITDDSAINVVFLAGGIDAAGSSAANQPKLELLWKVNLCTPASCDDLMGQWAFSQLFATAYYKMTSLGLPEDWIGHSRSLTGSETIDFSSGTNVVLLPFPTADVNSTGPNGTSKAQDTATASTGSYNTGVQTSEGLGNLKQSAQPSSADQFVHSLMQLMGAAVLGLLWIGLIA